MRVSYAFAALASALLFGASVPVAKALTGAMPPVLLAGLLYLGSGVGVLALRTIRERRFALPVVPSGEWRSLAAAIVVGGVIAPVLLMIGLTRTPASQAALLLNLEAVLTVFLAWVAFREHVGARNALGMALIVAGGIVLAWPAQSGSGAKEVSGPVAVAGACLCWALDNNLTRTVSTPDVALVAGIKGLAAGATNTGVAWIVGAAWPEWHLTAVTLAVGVIGYGFSLVLFIVALRGLGSARTSAYFSTAPFVGALISVIAFREATSLGFGFAAMLMAAGVWLHLTERHDHEHLHGSLLHRHSHYPDVHHRHPHTKV